jgi:hypothetical protein
MATASHIPIAAPYLRVKNKQVKAVKDNKALFELQCDLYHIKHQVHENEEEWEKGILAAESRFSDLVVVSGELFYAELDSDQPNSFLMEALCASECPVMVIPEDYTPSQQLVITYDGSKDSLYAIKQFSYLMPQYTDLPTEFIYVTEDEKQEIPDLDNLKHYSRLHFGCMNFSTLHFKASDYFSSWLSGKKQVLLVSGSFGRSPFSYALKHSFAEQIIHDHRVPLFIAHS